MRFLLFLLLVSFSFSACNSNKDKITVTGPDGTETTVDMGNVNDAVKAMEQSQDKSEELKKLTPLSVDQLKALLPDEIMGMKRSRFSANSMMGAANATATYKSDDGKELKLNIFDCAGEAGSGIYTLRYWTLMNFQSEDDNGYTKTIDFKGQKAVESYKNHNEEYGITYMANDRFLVTVEGEKTGLDVVKQVAGGLALNVN